MMRRLVALALLLVALTAAQAAFANPFQPGATRETSTQQAPAPDGFLAKIAKAQREMNESIAAKFHELEAGSSAALIGILLLSFAYGALHAAGPGHGKSVVASYLLARPQSWPAGVAIGMLSSLLQGAVSVLLVILLALVFEVGGLDLMAHATVIEVVSYGLIVAIGGWLLFNAVTGRGCGHGHHHHDHAGEAHDHHHHHHGERDNTMLGMILAAGITPCASAIIVMLFALAQDSLAVGILAAFAMSLGMGVTVSAVALLSIFGRRTVTAAVAGNAQIGMVVERGLMLAGSLLVIGLAGLLLLGAWTRL
jgi:ABC-type nickel/cobalt efflux system permease component RcnA